MELIIATNNANKLKEFGRILAPLGVVVHSQKEYCPDLDVEETGTTFAANARLKAEAVYKATGLTAVADDSGLCVDALDGAPGVYSARYAGENATDAQRIEKLLEELKDVPDEKRTGRFVSAICCIGPDLLIECEGVCEGIIGRECRGEGGFGYDPVFYVEGRSYSEMTGEEKDAVSHRGRALRLFYDEMNRRMNRADQ
ncbi:MAG: RdgB/HAM1 family non-canonical purine NTP pyrophosphatase [Oscillospiraceae bacterium]|nr:RdgB/HAM1 family non-canonical purine NTP pyrophosphatase [Oscillospiraceae bacterium]